MSRYSRNEGGSMSQLSAQRVNNSGSHTARSQSTESTATTARTSPQRPLPSHTEVHTSSPIAAGLPVLEVVRRLEEEKLINREDRSALKEGLYSEDPQRRQEIVNALCEVELSMNGKFAIHRLKAKIHQNAGGERSSKQQNQKFQQQRQDSNFYASLMKRNNGVASEGDVTTKQARESGSDRSHQLDRSNRASRRSMDIGASSGPSNNAFEGMSSSQVLRSQSADYNTDGVESSDSSDSSDDDLIAALRPQQRKAKSSGQMINHHQQYVQRPRRQQPQQKIDDTTDKKIPMQMRDLAQIRSSDTISTVSGPTPTRAIRGMVESGAEPRAHSDIAYSYGQKLNTERTDISSIDTGRTRFTGNRKLHSKQNTSARSIADVSSNLAQPMPNPRDQLLIGEFSTQSAICDVVGEAASYSGPENFNVLSKIQARLEDYFARYGNPDTNLKSAKRKFAVLVGGGSFNPLTRMHLRTYFLAKNFLETRHGFVVLGSLLSPAHGATVRERYRTNPLEILPSPHRLAIAQLLVQNSKLMCVDPWEITRRRAMDYLSLLEHTNTMIKEQIIGVGVKVMYVCKPNQVPKLSPQAMRSQGFGCVTVCRSHESDILRKGLSAKWNGVIHVVEDTAILDASLDVVTSRKVRDKLKEGKAVGHLVGEKINEYLTAHRIGPKMCGDEKWENHEKILPSLASRPAEPVLRSQSTFSINKSKLEQHNKTMALQQMNDDDVDVYGLSIQYEGNTYRPSIGGAQSAKLPVTDEEGVNANSKYGNQQSSPSSISKMSSHYAHSTVSASANGQRYAPSWMSSDFGGCSEGNSEASFPSSNVGSVGNGVVGPMRGMLPAFEYDADS